MLKDLFQKQHYYLREFFDRLDLTAAEAIFQTFLECKGSLVFSGVGKSGIIAEKVAMTMISLGTKALYLPPINALHGDIGILTKDDVFVCISKSGESEELYKLVPHIKERGAKTILWSCKETGKLKKICDLSITLPLEREICPYDLAPTTSAAIQLIFGDTLAVALMKSKEFTIQDFAKNHPAGNIGKKLTYRVEDVMLKDDQVPTCFPENTLSQALIELTDKKCGCILIIDEARHLRGIFTDGDLRRALQRDKHYILEQKMKDLITETCLTIEKGKCLFEALEIMQYNSKKWVKELPVLSNSKVVGLIRMHDIVQIGIN